MQFYAAGWMAFPLHSKVALLLHTVNSKNSVGKILKRQLSIKKG
jgi:hypothetical protein